MAPRCEFIGRPDGPGSFAERLTIREARSRYQPKVAHRADPDVVSIDRGPHDVAALALRRGDRDHPPAWPAGAPRDPEPGAGRELVAGGGHAVGVGAVVAGADPPLPGPVVGAVRRRTQIAIFEGMFPDRGRFQRLREHYEEGRFEELYRELIFDESEVEAGLETGRLVVDERFARMLERCPDPLAGGPSGTLRVEPSPEELERDRAELEFDAMYVLARTSRWLMVNRDRNRERLVKVMEQRDAAQAREQGRPAAGASPGLRPWTRLRRAFGRRRD